MAAAPAPVWELVVWFLTAPPIGALIWRFMARGWAMGVQGGRVSERTAKRQRLEFRWLIAICYAVEVVILVLAAAKGTL